MTDLLEIMRTRRSVRKYTEEKISDENIKKILSAALLAPSGHSKYPCEFIVVKNRETLNKMSHCRVNVAKMLESAFAAVVVIAEPAVWVLTDQVESVSGGTIKRRVMLVALSAGVAASIGISMLRVLTGFSLWYVLIPGYALSLLLAFFCPKLFTGIAFDSGGVASGTMTSTFILSFTLGASQASCGNPAVDAFGVIALVAMTPLIAIQLLGMVFKLKQKRNRRSA